MIAKLSSCLGWEFFYFSKKLSVSDKVKKRPEDAHELVRSIGKGGKMYGIMGCI